jgi:hypothetical protein
MVGLDLRRFGAEGWNLADVLVTLSIPGIVRGLHTDPNSGTIAEQFTQANCHSRRHWLPLAQNIVEMLARDAEKLGNLSFGPAGRWNNVLPQQRTGMGRTTSRIPFGSMNHN